MSSRPTDMPRMPAGVWVLGFVSLLMDVSSEMIHSLLPLFLVGTLGASVLAVGIIEGAGRSDRADLEGVLRRAQRLPRQAQGPGAARLRDGRLDASRVFALANGVGAVVAARFIDRVGKGIRGAPRDALVADVTPPGMRGAAFGLRQSLDTVGAFAGPLLAIGLMLAWANDFRAVFWVAVDPGRARRAAACWLGIREPAHDRPRGAVNPIRREALARLRPRLLVGRRRRRGVHAGALQRGVPGAACLAAAACRVAWVPLVMVAMNLVYAACAYPFGKLSDR